MGRTRKSKKKNTYRYNANRKKLWKRSKRLPGIMDDAVRENWVYNRTTGYNLKKMGISGDPNASIEIPYTRKLMKKKLASNEVVKKTKDDDDEDHREEQQPVGKTRTIEALEKNAKRTIKPSFHVSLEVSMFAKYMTDKYGQNYKAMSQDPKNYYQLTPSQIRIRIQKTKKSQMITATRIIKKMMKKEEPDPKTLLYGTGY